MIDIRKEPPIRLNKAGLLPGLRADDGRPASAAKLHRLATRGARAANGNRVLLETVILSSGCRYTTAAAAERLIAALNGQTVLMPNRSDAIGRAEAELSAAGIN